MIYTKENEIINIIRSCIAGIDIASMRRNINSQFIESGHPYECTTDLVITLNESGQTEISYYIKSTDSNYDDISGIMSL